MVLIMDMHLKILLLKMKQYKDIEYKMAVAMQDDFTIKLIQWYYMFFCITFKRLKVLSLPKTDHFRWVSRINGMLQICSVSHKPCYMQLRISMISVSLISGMQQICSVSHLLFYTQMILKNCLKRMQSVLSHWMRMIKMKVTLPLNMRHSYTISSNRKMIKKRQSIT